MSSGNPFRRAQSQPSTTSAAAPLDVAFGVQHNTSSGRSEPIPTPSPQPKTRKTVRIRTPPAGTPISPEFKFSPLRERQSRSPSPPEISHGSSDSSSDEDDDPFGRFQDTNGYGRSATPSPLVSQRPSTQSAAEASIAHNRTVPANPFARTLADIEPAAIDGQDVEGRRAAKPPNAFAKSTVDVDAFTDMLLGKRQSNTGQQTDTKRGTTPYTGSNNDARPAPQSASAGSSRSASNESLREALSSMQSEEGAKDTQAAGNIDSRTARSKPPPPKSRHGKGLSMHTPRTSPPPDLKSAEPIARPQSDVVLTPPNLNEPSQMPLPKKIPPAVPLTRRHSQMKRPNLANSAGRSSSSLTFPSTDSVSTLVGPAEAETIAPRAAPRPPPARRRGHQSISHPSPPPFVDGEAATSPGFLSPGGTEPRGPAVQANPVPPPPPRKGGSGRTSIDSQRSASTFEAVSAVAASDSEERDRGSSSRILDDMDAFQAEIDALLRK